jgi:hypothetical protein
MKPETPSFDAIVSDAFARMQATSAAAPSYRVDRSSGQWVVKRTSSTGAVFAYDVYDQAAGNQANPSG